MKHTRLLLFVLLACCLAACATPAQTVAVTASGASALAAFVKLLFDSGLIDEAQKGQFLGIVDGIGSTITQFLDAVHKTSSEVATVKEQQANQITPEGVAKIGGGITATAVAVAEVIRRIKNGPGPTPDEKARRVIAHQERKLVKARKRVEDGQRLAS